MNRDEIRLECIRLAVSRTSHEDAIARAEEYFRFVTKPEEKPSEVVKKHTGNATNPK